MNEKTHEKLDDKKFESMKLTRREAGAVKGGLDGVLPTDRPLDL